MAKIFGFRFKKLKFNEDIVNKKWLGAAAKSIEKKIFSQIYSYFPKKTIHRKQSFQIDEINAERSDFMSKEKSRVPRGHSGNDPAKSEGHDAKFGATEDDRLKIGVQNSESFGLSPETPKLHFKRPR